MKHGDTTEFQEAIKAAAEKMYRREAGAVDDAIAAMLVAGARIEDIEVAHYPYGLGDNPAPFTVVRSRR